MRWDPGTEPRLSVSVCQPCQPHPFPISQGHPSQQLWVLTPEDRRDSLALAGRQEQEGLGAVRRLKTKRHWPPLCWGLGPPADFPSLWTMSSFWRPPCMVSSSEKKASSWSSPGMSVLGKWSWGGSSEGWLADSCPFLVPEREPSQATPHAWGFVRLSLTWFLLYQPGEAWYHISPRTALCPPLLFLLPRPLIPLMAPKALGRPLAGVPWDTPPSPCGVHIGAPPLCFHLALPACGWVSFIFPGSGASVCTSHFLDKNKQKEIACGDTMRGSGLMFAIKGWHFHVCMEGALVQRCPQLRWVWDLMPDDLRWS